MKNWDFLPCFMVAADKQNFTRAAESLFYSQAYVSKQIAELEAELGTSLFIRKNKSVELTEAGQFLYDRAGHINNEISQLQKEMEQFRTINRKETLNIFCDSYSYFITDEIAKEFLRHSDSCSIKILNELIVPKPDDTDITCFYTRDSEACSLEVLSTRKEIVVLHEDSPVAGKKRLQLTDLKNCKCLILSTNERHLQWKAYLEDQQQDAIFDETDSVYVAMARLAQDPTAYEIWEDYSHICQPLLHHVIRPISCLGALYYHMDITECKKPAAKELYQFAKDYFHMKHEKNDEAGKP